MSSNLFELLQSNTIDWRNKNYPSNKYPAIAEIFNYNRENDAQRYLREPQFRALEIYWYLRLIEKTPKTFDLYQKYFINPIDLLQAFGITTQNPELLKELFNLDGFWMKVKSDTEFVKSNRLDALKESYELDYPSYILALAMGAGKTVLIGAIIAMEFALSIEYQDDTFMQNALVFAPGTTIIESLKEISDIPYQKIIPPRLYRPFMANIKLTYTRNGEKTIPVEEGGLYNVIVTNTEKIMLRVMRKNRTQTELEFKKRQEEETLYANLRLQKIASLPNLGIFSDEAHHTYGQKLESDLKRVRSTINYLNKKKKSVCVINTTGTPYFKGQTLKDVIFWYGLAEGIKDNILKSLEGGIRSYDFKDDELPLLLEDIVKHFWKQYGDVRLPSGSRSKIAFYFPQEETLVGARPYIEAALAGIGQSATIVLKNTQKSKKQDIDNFNALNDPNSPFRIILLVGKGTEGWNCPSLFATALIRKITGANNFLLQAGMRCLRQIPGNNKPATVYIDGHNYNTLDKELRETYGSRLADLDTTHADLVSERLVIIKTEIPKLLIRKLVRKVVATQKQVQSHQIKFTYPDVISDSDITVTTYLTGNVSEGKVLYASAEQGEHIKSAQTNDLYTASLLIADNYHLDQFAILKSLRKLYTDEIPPGHLQPLMKQAENQLSAYEIKTETVEEALAILRMKNADGEDTFQKDESGQYYTEIRYTRGNDSNFLHKQATQENPKNFGFHYTPYNFDSGPEKDFYLHLLKVLNEKPEDIEDIYFTGALTDPNKTDFCFEYKGNDNKYHFYFPDFILRKKPAKGSKEGKFYIVEIKSERERAHTIDGEKGFKAQKMTELLQANKDKFKYEMIFAPGDTIPANKLEPIKDFIKNG